ncbi:MAG: serine hydrolase domain-containing protein [Nitrospirota bacterium]
MIQPDPISRAMEAAVEEGVFPGAVLAVRLRGSLLIHRAFGRAALVPKEEPARLDTIYDLASLTKPLATATATLCLVQSGRLDPDDQVGHLIEELKEKPVGAATVLHLLSHCSGLPAWRPFYERVSERDHRESGFLGSSAARGLVLSLIGDEPLESPIGERARYSDLGFILLGLIVERLAGCSLARFVTERVYRPVGAELFFVEQGTHPVDPARIAPTEQDPWRGRLIRGEVHDENAYALGGVAGHSGLFGTAEAVLDISGCWLNGYLERDSPLQPALVRRFASRQAHPARSSWGLGWDTPSAPSSSGTKFSPSSFGHLGYTGTSLWVDPERELEVVLLTNRVHPTRQNEAIRAFRPKIHDIIYQELIAEN